MKGRGWRVPGGKMGMRRGQIVEKEKRRSWLIERERLQGKWKDYTMGKSRKRGRKEGNSQCYGGTLPSVTILAAASTYLVYSRRSCFLSAKYAEIVILEIDCR